MLVGHVFDFSIVLRSRRREMRLRQEDLADYCGVSRGFISDLEHGKPSVEFGKVLQVMAALNVPMSIGWKEEPPTWAKPFRKRGLARERRYAERRRLDFEKKARPYPKTPASFLDRDRIATKALKYQRAAAGVMWTKEEVDRFIADNEERRRREHAGLVAKAAAKGFAAELVAARARIVRAVAWRGGCFNKAPPLSFRGGGAEPGIHDNAGAG